MGNNGFISIILPTLTLALAMSAKYTRQVRATVLDELNKDYVIGARARGIKERTIVLAHVLKSSMLTIVTLLGLSLGSLLGGTAIAVSYTHLRAFILGDEAQNIRRKVVISPSAVERMLVTDRKSVV